jgi:MoaA/NifB/PqqE/SkfB family radical SAM enzyme
MSELTEKTEGRSYTSNHVKMLKHLDKLQTIQQGMAGEFKVPSPIMFHMSPCNPCNLTCTFCCFANRAMKEMLTLEQMKTAIDSFVELGTTGMELTGGGEPTLHPDFDTVVDYAYSKGLKIGVCTNGTKLNKIKSWDKMAWVRLGMYGFYEGYDYDLSVFDGLDIEISAAYVWDEAIETSTNPNITGEWIDPSKKRLSKKFQQRESFLNMIEWVEANKIPTRIAFNAIKPVHEVEKDIEIIREVLDGRDLKYAFLSDFNFKGQRKNNHCYMHMVKPCVFTDGNVYVCPSAELAPENNYQVNDEFKICDIDGILDFYKNGGVTRRHHNCSFCKYAMQNELIDDIVRPTKHNEFA